MSAETQQIKYDDLELKSLIVNGTLYLRQHQSNYRKLRSIKDNDNLIKLFTRYVVEMCEMATAIRSISFPDESDTRLRDDTLPVGKDYVEFHYGIRVKSNLLQIAADFRRKISVYKTTEAQYEEIKNRKETTQEEIKMLEESMNSKRPNMFSDLLDSDEVKRFFFPSKPSSSEGTISTAFEMPS